MSRIETLTAYNCKFSYTKKKNPLINVYRESIKSGKVPEFTFSDFISLYAKNSGDVLIGKNSDRAIGLPNSRIFERTIIDTKSWYISPLAGKQGQPMTVLKCSTGKKYNFGADSAALYNYHLFVYENGNRIIAIFHRQNGSGCKSVFLETANNVLKEKGLKLEMNLIVPLSDTEKEITLTKITLQCVENNFSTDATDNLRKKKTVIRDIGLNLEVQDNSPIAAIIHDLQLGKITKDVAFAQIKNEVKFSDNFNDAEVKFRIGRRTRRVSWDDFENVVGIHDISEELHSAYKRTNNFVSELTKLADQYYYDIIKSGAINNE